MSNKGWTTIYHWICPITPPFSLLPTETTVCALQLACGCWGAGSTVSGPSPFLLGQCWQGLGLGERLFDRPPLAPRAGHLCYKMPPSLWSGTRLSQPGLAQLLWIDLLCYLVSPMAAWADQLLLYPMLKPFNLCCWDIFSDVMFTIFIIIDLGTLISAKEQQKITRM